MKKKLITGLLIMGCYATCASVAQGVMVQSETIQSDPLSTDNLWAYSYIENSGYISSAYYDWVTDSDPFRDDAVFQGYVTGDAGPGTWSDWADSFSSNGTFDYNSVHVFDTYITSSVDQTVTLSAGGDDGHSIFVDDVFLAGAGYYGTASTDFTMVANTQYKLTLVADNYTGPWAVWFKIAGDGWTGSVCEADNISMNATGTTPAPVPEPATMLLFGTGLAGLAGWRKKNTAK